MKITKRQLTESKQLTEAPLDPVDLNQSTDAVADELRTQITVADGADQVPSEKAAEDTAKDAQELGDKIGADKAVVVPDEGLKVENAITRTLDEALEESFDLRDEGSANRANVLIVGLPGSSKTASIYDWAKRAKGEDGAPVNIVYVNAKNTELDAWMNGYTMADKDQNLHVSQAVSDNLAELEKPNSILFIDEYNRQTRQNIRASLYTLINEHYVTGNAKVNPNDVGGRHYFKNFLFTIAAMNPYLGNADEGAAPLNSAEYGRFIHILEGMDSTVEACEAYIEKQWNKFALNILRKPNPNFDRLHRILAAKWLGLYLVGDENFKFDDIEKAKECARNPQHNLLSQRVITTALDIFKADIDKWIGWLNGSRALPNGGSDKGSSSLLLDEDAQMIEEILTAAREDMPTEEELFNNNQDLFDEAGVTNPFTQPAQPEANNADTGAEDAAQPEAEKELSPDEQKVKDADDDMWGAQPTSANGQTTLSPNATQKKITDLMSNW